MPAPRRADAMKTIILSILFLVALPAAVAGPAQSVLAPSGIQAHEIYGLWRLTLLICGVVFAAVLAAFLYSIWRAPHSPVP